MGKHKRFKLYLMNLLLQTHKCIKYLLQFFNVTASQDELFLKQEEDMKNINLQI